ncbi:hypothetical protein C2E31_08260 [Rhodopirellula baltica]|nr:hypothetical protein C2E31_08260 [Rhodopirellula baltica]
MNDDVIAQCDMDMPEMIAESWDKIIVWLQANAPAKSLVISGPATATLIDEVASQLGIDFPVELAEFYQLLDGAESCAAFPSPDDYDDMAFTPMPLNEIISDWESQKELVEVGQFDDCTPQSDTGIIDEWWNVGWIPFASNGGGDYLCIDTAPTRDGKKGQVISHSHESGEHRLLANSLSEYLSVLSSDFESGKYEYHARYGVRIPVESVTKAEPREEHVRNPWTFESETLPAANDAFRNKDYARCVELLVPYEDMLDKVAASKLALARKRCE